MKYLLVIIFLFLSSCVEFRDPDQTNPVPSAVPQPSPASEQKESSEIQAPINSNNETDDHNLEASAEQQVATEQESVKIETQIISDSSPNSYKLNLFWNTTEAQILERQPEGEEALAQTAINQQEYLDAEVKPGHSYTYRLKKLVDNEWQTLAESKIKIPLDYVFDKPVEVPTGTGALKIGPYARLYFSSEAVLYNYDRDIIIIADELISDGAIIRNFVEGQKAAVGNGGRSGGQIKIFAKSARGQLKVFLSGENGGDGYPGADIGEEGRGATGARGADAVYRKEQRNEFTYDICEVEPTNGGQGGQGAAGPQGSGGYLGGNSGALYVEIQDSTDFILTPIRYVGEGGYGGRGGYGGPGGLGGEPGIDKFANFNYAVLIKCQHIPQIGPQGLQGNQGPQGPRGGEGQAQRICIKLSDAPADCF